MAKKSRPKKDDFALQEDPLVLQMRQEFQNCMDNATYEVDLSPWQEAVAALAKQYFKDEFPDKAWISPTPAHWLKAAQQATVTCPACNGSGRYTLRSGNTNTCFRCGGKGKQNQEDFVRNANYDNHRRVI
jgi:hypothetical protein